MKNFILWIWQLPQNLVGFLIYLFHKNDRTYGERIVNGKTVKFWYLDKFFHSGISLGSFIFLDGIFLGSSYVTSTIPHEYGHTVQSKIFGPLYLIFVGLPSLCGNIIDRVFHKKWDTNRRNKWYYNQPWEKWADKFGKVKRKLCQ